MVTLIEKIYVLYHIRAKNSMGAKTSSFCRVSAQPFIPVSFVLLHEVFWRDDGRASMAY